MYPEFIVIYIGLVVIISLLIIILFKMTSLLKKITNNSLVNQVTYQSVPTTTHLNLSKKVVFCKHCATEYDASLNRCPNCGTLR